MKEIQQRKTLPRLPSAVASAGIISILAFTACDTQNIPSPLPVKESLSSSKKAGLLEDGLHLDGSGFILIPNTGGFPKDNFAVEVLLEPDPPSKVLSQITERGKVLYEDVYTIFTQKGILGGLELTMYTRGNPDNWITYSYVVHWTDRNDPLDISTNSCPVIAGYGAERQVSVTDFARPKNITLRVKEGKPEVFEDGKPIKMKMRREYMTPKGYYTFKPEEYRSDGYLVYNQLIKTPCSINNVGLGIGGAMFPDGTMAGHFDGVLHRARVYRIKKEAGWRDDLRLNENTVAAWDFGNGLKDLSGNGYDGRIVGDVSIR